VLAGTEVAAGLGSVTEALMTLVEARVAECDVDRDWGIDSSYDELQRDDGRGVEPGVFVSKGAAGGGLWCGLGAIGWSGECWWCLARTPTSCSHGPAERSANSTLHSGKGEEHEGST
jgi:hypothetical protein